MIKLNEEGVISLTEAARLVPSGREGRPVNVSTLYRWALKGVGGVRLDAVRIGSRWYTSKEALQRFTERLTTQSLPEEEEQKPSPRTPTRRKAEQENVQRQLKEYGV